MTATLQERAKAQQIRDRVQWVLAECPNTFQGILASLNGTGVNCMKKNLEQALNTLMRKQLVSRERNHEFRWVYSIVPLKDKNNA